MRKFECHKCNDLKEPCVFSHDSKINCDFAACPFNPHMQGEWNEITAPSLPKLTIEALNERGIEWPEWARAATVDPDGRAFFSDGITGMDYHNGWIFANKGMEIPGEWDISDWRNSKIFLPKKNAQSDWHKVGSWVLVKAENRSPFYGKIFELLRGGDGASITLDGKSVIGAFDFRHLLPASFRHWNDEELAAQVGRVFDFPKSRELCVCFIPGKGLKFMDYRGEFFTAERLAYNLEVSVDGLPCGVLEVVKCS